MARSWRREDRLRRDRRGVCFGNGCNRGHIDDNPEIERGADRSAGVSQRPGMMKAAEKGSGRRVRGTHQDILGRPMLGDRSCVDEQDMVGDIAGEGDLVRHDNHRGAVFAELPHDREHFSDQFEI